MTLIFIKHEPKSTHSQQGAVSRFITASKEAINLGADESAIVDMRSSLTTRAVIHNKLHLLKHICKVFPGCKQNGLNQNN